MRHCARRQPIRRQKLIAILVCSSAFPGCHVQSPGGTPIETQMLGSVTDQINQQQERNADASKFVIYNHEFELNVPLQNATQMTRQEKFRFQATERVRGFRLSPYGEDHVYQIAESILKHQEHSLDAAWTPWDVIIERSETSKLWDTRYRYPVHFNAELDEARRQTVVALLSRLGVVNADQIVLVAPAFSEGAPAGEAASAWQSSRSNGNQRQQF